MMSPTPENPQRQDKYLVSAGGKHWWTDQNQLLTVTEVHGWAPLPCCPAQVLGLLATAHGPLALLALDEASGKSPSLAAVVMSAQGPLALAIDRVAKVNDAAPQAPDDPSLTGWLQSLTGGFGPAGETAQQTPAPSPGSTPVQFLVVNDALEAPVALRASNIRRIERCPTLNPVQGQPGHRHVVQLGGQLLPAQGLSTLLGKGPGTSEPSWCLQLQGSEHTQAVLVQSLDGHMEVPAHAIQTLQVGGRASQWVLRDGHPPVEIVLEGPSEENVPVLNASDTGPLPPSAAAGHPICRALQANAGPYAIVFAAALLGPVIGAVHRSDLMPCRPAHAQGVRVWDLDALLGLDTAGPAEHAFVLQWANTPVVLLCRQLHPVTTLDTFHPAPSLPSALAGLVQGIRMHEGQAQLLVSPPSPHTDPRPFLRQHLKKARAGWIATI